MTSLFDLTGKVVVATGGASGIGQAFLRGCARQGASVIVWDRAEDRFPEALEDLRQAGAARAEALLVDVADEAQVAEAMARTLEIFSRVDCLLANAGFSNRAPSFPDLTSEAWHGLLAVNLHGAFYSLRAAARHMRERALAGDTGGSLVVTGSLSIFHGLQGMEHYSGAKGALAAVVNGLAVEMGQYGVRANMLAPGFILSGMTQASPQAEAMIERMRAITPLGRPGEPADIEGPAAYLASDASRFHTGDVLVVDGGRRVKAL